MFNANDSAGSHNVNMDYCRELTPGILRMALLLRNVQIPSRGKRPLHYLELGYGQGLSLAIHAASVPGEYWGTDINPNNTLDALERLKTTSIDHAQLLNLSFAEFAARDDLPMFDIIVMHGVWSLVDDDSRRSILNIIKNRLVMGGLVYVDYDALPGWAAAAPLRDLFALHSGMAQLRGGGAERTATTLHFAANIAQAKAAYFTATPQAENLLGQLMSRDLSFVHQQYFNTNWKPQYFAEMARTFGLVRLTFGAPANLLEHLNIAAPEHAALLATISDPVLRETTRDFLENRNFRRDVFIKGEHQMTLQERLAAISALRVTLALQVEGIPLRVSTPLGECDLKEELYAPVLTVLAENNYAPKTVEELEDHVLLKNMDSATLLEILTVLVGAGYAHPAQEDAEAKAATPHCARLNTVLCQQARTANCSQWLASPVLGGGVLVARVEQLFLQSFAQKGGTPADWGTDAWMTLAGHGEKLLRDDTPLEFEEAEKEMILLAERFDRERLPFLTAMGVMPAAE